MQGVLCVYDKPCLDKNKQTLECNFDDLCNQQAKPYKLNGDIVYMRQSDLMLFVLAKTISETIIKKRLKP